VVLFTYFVVILLMSIDVLTKAIFLIHQQTLETALTNLIAPEMTGGGGSGSNLGRTFTQIEIGWLVATLIGLFLLAFFTAARHRATRKHPFDLATCLVVYLLVLVSLLLLVPQLNY